MTAAARWAPRLVFVWVVALFAARSQLWGPASVLALAALASGLLPWRATPGRTGQLLAAAAGLALIWPTLAAFFPTESAGTVPVARFAAGVALAGILVALPRHFMAAPGAGERGNAALNLLAMIGCSRGASGELYPVGVVIFALLQLYALRAADPGRPPLRALTRRHSLAAGVMLLITCAAGAGLALGIPPAQRWAIRSVYASFIKGSAGFSTNLNLGSLDDIYLSEEKVLRVYGPKPDHLRGAVFNRYRDGRWLLGRTPSSRHQELAPEPAASATPRTRVVTLGGDTRRYFIPLGARAVSSLLGVAQVDALGLLTTPPGEAAEEVAFSQGERDRFPLAGPGEHDLELPAAIQAQLRRIVGGWVSPGLTPGQRLAAIETRLQQEYRYSLSFERPEGEDPLIHFLTRGKRGHCEYFASAMALLARAAGVPTRVVTGYRVHERNALGGYHLVRERNAHSWVEGWEEGRGWRTHDPTPTAELERTVGQGMSTAAALADLLAAGLRQGWTWLTRRTLGQMGAAAGALLAAWILVRLMRRQRRLAARANAPWALAYGDPLPALDELLRALAARGMGRRPSEPLESFARRLASDFGGLAEVDQAVDLLRRYSAWRYGGLGDSNRLTEALAQAAASGQLTKRRGGVG